MWPERQARKPQYLGFLGAFEDSILLLGGGPVVM
jgi:hypothetical protein